MSEYTTLAIAAINLVPAFELDPEDVDVPGIYQVSVLKDVPAEVQASAALDRFHVSVSVGQLYDFEFWVFDPETKEVMPPCEVSEGYEHEDKACDVRAITKDVPGVVEVKLRHVSGKPTETTRVVLTRPFAFDEMKASVAVFAKRHKVAPKEVLCYMPVDLSPEGLGRALAVKG